MKPDFMLDGALHWYALCAVVLFLKMFGVSLYQGYHRIGRRHYRNPEDAAFSRSKAQPEELPQVQRAARAWANDLENIPAFFALGLIYILLGLSPVAAPWLFGIFTVSRIAHTLCYLASLQPWRTIAYALGIGCLLAISSMILIALF